MKHEVAIELIRSQYPTLMPVHRDFVLQPGTMREIEATDDVYLLLGYPVKIVIVSQEGIYDYENPGISECQHTHGDLIRIENRGQTIERVEFLAVMGVKTPRKRLANHRQTDVNTE